MLLTKQEKYPLTPNEYQIEGRIARHESDIYKAKCITRLNEQIAIKIQDLSHLSNTDKIITSTEYDDEISILRQIDHQNIQKLLATFTFKTEVWMISPLMIGSLYDIIYHKTNTIFNNGFDDELIISTISYDILSAIQYLQNINKISRKLFIKPQHILLSADGVCKICDIGYNYEWYQQPIYSGLHDICYFSPETLEESIEGNISQNLLYGVLVLLVWN